MSRQKLFCIIFISSVWQIFPLKMPLSQFFFFFISHSKYFCVQKNLRIQKNREINPTNRILLQIVANRIYKQVHLIIQAVQLDLWFLTSPSPPPELLLVNVLIKNKRCTFFISQFRLVKNCNCKNCVNFIRILLLYTKLERHTILAKVGFLC